MEERSMTPLETIRDQLNWRGPSGKPPGHVVLKREVAEELLQYIEQLRSTVPPEAKLAKRPVAFLVLSPGGDKHTFFDEATANSYAGGWGVEVQGLYVRDGTPNVLEGDSNAQT